MDVLHKNHQEHKSNDNPTGQMNVVLQKVKLICLMRRVKRMMKIGMMIGRGRREVLKYQVMKILMLIILSMCLLIMSIKSMQIKSCLDCTAPCLKAIS